VATAELARQPHRPDLEPAPLLELCLDLAPGLQVRVDRCIGDVPLMEIITGRARLLAGVDVGHVNQLNAEHLAVAEAFAHAATTLHDELRQLAAAPRRRPKKR
jgi:hypothetical protein